MENNKENSERHELGQQLHRVETEICLGRRALVELLANDPVDQEVLAVQRQIISEARLARNAIRPQLKRAKIALPQPWQYKW